LHTGYRETGSFERLIVWSWWRHSRWLLVLHGLPNPEHTLAVEDSYCRQ